MLTHPCAQSLCMRQPQGLDPALLCSSCEVSLDTCVAAPFLLFLPEEEVRERRNRHVAQAGGGGG